MLKYVMIYLVMAIIAGATVPLQAGNKFPFKFFQRFSRHSIHNFIFNRQCHADNIRYRHKNSPALRRCVYRRAMVDLDRGILGAFYVASCVILANKLGAVSMLALIMAGQMITSVVLDHYGLAGYQVQPLNLYKIFGILLVIAGGLPDSIFLR